MNIANIRRKLNWSQEQLADRAGISQTLVSRAESGDDGVTLRRLRLIAAALQVPLIDLFDARPQVEADLLVAFRSLPSDRQKVWLEMSRSFVVAQAKASEETT